jgi:hypothetical protein
MKNVYLSGIPATLDEAFIAFRDFIDARPGIRAEDYNGYTQGLNADRGNASRARQRALSALYEFGALSLDRDILATVMQTSYSGRLIFDNRGILHYTAGQFRSVEYRKAAAVVLEIYNIIVNDGSGK